jgi:hypothetical protein
VARGIAATLQAGGRPLRLEAGDRRLASVGGGALLVRIPSGVVATVQRGPDFMVNRLRQLAPLGTPAASLGIYVGAHPSYQYRQQGRSKPTESVAATVFGRSLEWLIWSPRDGWTTAETIVPHPSAPDLQIHLFASGPTGAPVEAMRTIATSLKLAPP